MHFKKHVFIYGMYVCVYICIPNIYIYIFTFIIKLKIYVV